VLLVFGCGTGMLDPSASPRTEVENNQTCAKTAHEIHYALDWEWGRAKPLASGSGWEVVNNLGYRIEIDKMYLVTYRTGLIACEEADLVDVNRVNPYQMCTAARWSWSLVSTAYAGHSFTDDDPVVINTQHVEDLSNPKSFDLGLVTVSEQRYCRLHYLLARAEREATGLPEDVALVDSSTYFEGRYYAPGSNEAVTFSVLDSSADGALIDITAETPSTSQALGMINVNFEGARVHIIRNLGLMWDDVDFLSMSSRDIARRVLGNLTSTLKVEIERTP